MSTKGTGGESEAILGAALRTDHIDRSQLHRPDPDTDLEVRAIGSSNFPSSEIVEAQWASQRAGTEQPTYSLLNRGIESEILPVCRRYGLGVLVWSPLAMGLLTGRYRPGGEQLREAQLRFVPQHMSDERKHAAVEQFARVAEEAGLSLAHLALAFAVHHPAVTSAIIGPRTLPQLEDLLSGADLRLDDELLDWIDEIVAPGTDVGPIDVAYVPPSLTDPTLRRQPAC
ncbi:aldo/keto reductase [Amycolatopsis sp. WGS_07]|uniref:aldo/keto reductase n=1 Tax=Amycolatopsis sp. WGS_07 TaxID=3076764 RepID=UPI003873BAA2